VVRKKESDARRELRRMRAELERSGDIPDRVPTVEVWMETWITRGLETGSLRPRTAEGHAGYVRRYVSPTIGRYRLDKLTAAHVERMTSHMVNELGLSPTTALQAHNIVKGALKAAMRAGHVSRNVAQLAQAPRKAFHKPRAMPISQAVQLLDWAHSQDAITDVRVNIAIWSGLRQGEALGLTREHVDMDAGFIHVVWQLQSLKTAPGKTMNSRHLGGSYYLTPPKSESGVRRVPIATPLMSVLERRLAEMPDDPQAFFITAPEGGPLEASRDSKRWHQYLDAAGVEQIKLHEARHTTATLMRAAGVDMLGIKNIVGHSAASMTEHYAHPLSAEDIANMARLAASMDAARGALRIEG